MNQGLEPIDKILLKLWSTGKEVKGWLKRRKEQSGLSDRDFNNMKG